MSKLEQLAERSLAIATLLGGTTPPTLEESRLGAEEMEDIAQQLLELHHAYNGATLYQELAED